VALRATTLEDRTIILSPGSLRRSAAVGGAAIGSVLGLGIRPFVNALTPGTSGRGRRSTSRKVRRARSRGMGADQVVLEKL